MATHFTLIHGDRVFEVVERRFGDFGINWTWMDDEKVCGVLSGLYPTAKAAEQKLVEFLGIK